MKAGKALKIINHISINIAFDMIGAYSFEKNRINIHVLFTTQQLHCDTLPTEYLPKVIK